jgi:hypothetical protein
VGELLEETLADSRSRVSTFTPADFGEGGVSGDRRDDVQEPALLNPQAGEQLALPADEADDEDLLSFGAWVESLPEEPS